MSDSTITSHLSRYGEIVQGSVTHGKIRGSDISNGTRYVKILNCVPILPLKDDIGRFTIRIYADNNRTPCRHCGETSHPYFKCTVDKPNHENTVTIKCWNCKGAHARRDCDKGTICHFCEQEGHLSASCPKKLYGEYADEIIEGRWNTDDTGSAATEKQQQPSDEIISLSDAETQQVPEYTAEDDERRDANDGDLLSEDISTDTGIGKKDTPCTDVTTDVNTEQNKTVKMFDRPKVIFGDSNAKRIRVRDKCIHNVAKSGATFKDVEEMADGVNIPDVEAIALHLGTNDLKQNKKMEVVQNAKNALEYVQKKWPKADVAFSTIIPRLGGSKPVKKINDDANFVNDEILKFCLSSKKFRYIDNGEIFNKNETPAKSLYDSGDPSGVHVNEKGAKRLYENLAAFLEGGISDEEEMPISRNKRSRSDGSQTSPSILKQSKQAKI